MNNKHLKLLVITTVAAATLPLHCLAENKVAIQVQQYKENDDRIDVNDGKFSIEHDFGPDHTVNVEFDWDSISGASPTWDSATGASAEAGSDAYTGASPCVPEEGENYYDYCRNTRLVNGVVGDGNTDIDNFSYKKIVLKDHRNSLAFLYTYRTPTMRNELSLGASYSKEEDFINTGVSAEYLMYTDRSKNRAITVGAAYMKNEVYDYLGDKDDHGEYTLGARWNDFDLINGQIGISQVFDANTVAKFNIFYMYESGHLSNPYFNVVRRINVIDAESDEYSTDDLYFKYYLARESRPEQRRAGGISMQAVKSFNERNTWHTSYRFYQDSWGIQSHTFESKSYHHLSEKFRFSPALRYYNQSKASFFKAHDAAEGNNIFAENGYASADHRLGKYYSWTGQFGFEYLQTTKMTWNIVFGHQNQSSGLTFSWVNFGAQYKY
ncbi:MAG: DUF3570 domain-containing protein [Colwellia sp.]|nr:DUF3570 domain-containing protein [Colwellia sp.]